MPLSRAPLLAAVLGAISAPEAVSAINSRARGILKGVHLGERQRVAVYRSRGGGRRRKK